MASLIRDNRKVADRLFVLEDSLIDFAKKFNLHLHHSPASIHTRLSQMSDLSLNRIEFNLWALLSVWQRCEAEQVDPWDDREFLMLSMRALSLSFPRDFMDNMNRDELVEGYDSDRFQIFRNMRFMETSSYSLLEIQSYEWPELFERSNVITESLLKYANDVLWENNATIPLDVPEHHICEIKAQDSQICVVNFSNMAPVFYGPDRRFGVLVSCSAKVIALDKPAPKLENIFS